MTENAISDETFRVLLDLFMVADPWPLEDKSSEKVVRGFLSDEASKRGYGDWVVAYHEFDPENAQ